MNYKISTFILVFLLAACGERSAPIPKPRLYPRVEFPVKDYQKFDESYCHFSFEYPQYAEIVKDTAFFGEKPLDECWFDIVMKDLNGKIHCSYFPIAKRAHLEGYVNDAYKFSSRHNDKADFRDELVITKPNDVSGILFDMKGEVATPVHFFLTDSTRHFFRASLYFYSPPNPDSMEIVHEFVKDDIAKMIETFEWDLN